VIQGNLVDLRPLTADDIVRIEDVANDPDHNGPFGTFALAPAGALARRFAEDGCLADSSGKLIVVDKDQVPVGEVSYHAVMHGPAPSNRAYNIGVAIDPAARGRGYGAEAQSLLARYLLDTYTVERVEASTDVENIAEQHALARAGFMREGILRRAQWRAGSWHDLVLYSKLRGE
jgi:RimJ/RimL family protein N-acetyltransferase